jgi:hypothetical protein
MSTLPVDTVSNAVTETPSTGVLDFSVTVQRAGQSLSTTATAIAAPDTVPAAIPATDKPDARPTAPAGGQTPRLGKHSRFLMALALFVAANAFLSFQTPFDFDPYKFVYRGWAWWTMEDVRRDTQQHNIALLGSSLMVSSINGADAVHTMTSVDLTKYHKATYLDYLLKLKLKGDFNTFNLAAPGQMPSDAYLTLKSMINVSQRPEVVVYGIAPRDFIDSTLSSPVDTEPFRYLRRIVNVDDVASGLYHAPFLRLDWCLQHSVYLYANSLDIQMATKEWLTDAMAYAVPQPPKTDRPFSWWDRTHLLPDYLKGEIIPNSMLAVPITPQEAVAQYTDNTKEYRERYKHPEPSIYQLQFYFLRRLAYYCHKEKIELILVNMPISRENVSLLNPTVYLQYLQAIKDFGFSYNIPVMDACDFDKYKKDDFHDTVHLNAYGGKKFIWNLVDALAANPRTRRALKLAGEELKRHQEIEEESDREGVQ